MINRIEKQDLVNLMEEFNVWWNNLSGSRRYDDPPEFVDFINWIQGNVEYP